MKIQHLPILALLVPLGIAQSPELLEYRSLCSEGQTEGTKTFDNGVTSEYTCYIKATGPIVREEAMNSAEECAAQCGNGCPGVVWQYTKKTCVFYDAPVSLSPHGRGSIYLKPTQGGQDHGEESSSASECLHEKQACEDELAHQLEISKSCQSEQEALALENQECQEMNDDLDTKSKTCQLEKDVLDTKLQTCSRERDGLDMENNSCKREKDDLDTKSKTCQREKDELNASWKAKYEKEVNGTPLKPGIYGSVLPGFYWAPNPTIMGKFPGVGTRIWQICADACKRDTSCRASVADYSTGTCYKTRMPAGGFTTKHLQDSIGGRYGSYIK